MKKPQFLLRKFYHLYNRGVDSRVVFSTKEDYDRFKAYLYILNDEDSPRVANFFLPGRKKGVYESARGVELVAIGAYSLLPNHFHLIVTPLTENGVSKFMQKIQTAYTMYFNKKYARDGGLFQSTFKAWEVKDDEDLQDLYAYIHLNPAKNFTPDWHNANPDELRMREREIFSYEYSSIGEYRGDEFVIVLPDKFPAFFKKSKDMRTHLQYWMRYKKKLNKKS